MAAFAYNYYEGYGAYEEISDVAILGMFIAYYQWGFDQNPFIRAYVCTYIKEHYREARADSC